jgi:hypothetical protein
MLRNLGVLFGFSIYGVRSNLPDVGADIAGTLSSMRASVSPKELSQGPLTYETRDRAF